MVEHGHMPMPEPGAPGVFAMADPDRIASLVSGAGFGAPEIEEIAVEWRFDDFEGYMTFVAELAGSLSMALSRLDDAQRAEVRATMERNAESFRTDGGYAFTGLAFIAAAT